jgi:hypothetical protein
MPTQRVDPHSSLQLSPRPSPTPIHLEQPSPTAVARHPEYFPEGRPRAFLEEVRRAKLPGDAHKLIAVIGALRRPRNPLDPPEIVVFTIAPREGLTVSQAIEAAGGFGDFADSRHVGLWKNESGTFLSENVRAVLQKDPNAHDPVLEPGDIVIVLQRRINM